VSFLLNDYLWYTIHAKSKLPTAKYTRLHSQSKVIIDWNDKNELYSSMFQLYNDKNFQELLTLLSAKIIELKTKM
jgi:hypothetical protein